MYSLEQVDARCKIKKQIENKEEKHNNIYNFR